VNEYFPDQTIPIDAPWHTRIGSFKFYSVCSSANSFTNADSCAYCNAVRHADGNADSYRNSRRDTYTRRHSNA
jgi:hypothetical protein